MGEWPHSQMRTAPRTRMATRVGIHTATTASLSGRWSLLLCRYVDLPKAFGQRARPD